MRKRGGSPEIRGSLPPEDGQGATPPESPDPHGGVVDLVSRGRRFTLILDFFGKFSGILLLAMVVIICYNVFMRMFTDSPPNWTVEITEYILLFVTFLSAAWVLKENAHISIDMLVNNVSYRTQRVFNIINCCLGIVICGLVGWHATKATYSLYAREVIMMGNLPWPKFALVLPIPFGIALTLIEFVRVLLRLVRGKSTI